MQYLIHRGQVKQIPVVKGTPVSCYKYAGFDFSFPDRKSLENDLFNRYSRLGYDVMQSRIVSIVNRMILDGAVVFVQE